MSTPQHDQDVVWTVVPEGDLELQDHEAIAAMLGRTFPDDDHWFIGARSWSGMQPERRIIGTTRDGVVVAHLGIRRQFVNIVGPDDLDGHDQLITHDQLVGAVGLVGVAPGRRGAGLGRELLRLAAEDLTRLGVPFGLLGTNEDRIAFYATAGWRLVDTVSSFSSSSSDGVGLTVVDDEGWLVLPVVSPIEDWPVGDLHWNAQQV